MTSPAPTEVVKRFLSAINAHDVHAVVGLLSPAHRFIDSLGSVISGIDAVEVAWRSYFQLVPDYRIDIDCLFASGQTVAVFGLACGAISGGSGTSQSWRVPAAWRAVVVGKAIAEWQVFADNKPVHEFLNKSSGNESGRPA